MTQENGVAVEVKAGIARVVIEAAGCAQCASCGLCRKAADGRSATMEIPAPEGLQPGDRVTLEIPGPGPGLSATILLLVPLVLFIVGVIGGEFLRRNGLPLGSWFSVVLGAALMGLGFWTAALYDRRLRCKAVQPQIVDWPGKNNGTWTG